SFVPHIHIKGLAEEDLARFFLHSRLDFNQDIYEARTSPKVAWFYTRSDIILLKNLRNEKQQLSKSVS
ncbi:hypothetical protein, partial [uncultured Trichococcus sp.]|uniref:hypothetical protein n=1 Tax=uncultured Trichococcus sp. TaxID=189665 RepID=UPI0025976A62